MSTPSRTQRAPSAQDTLITPEQRRAIETRNVSIALAAGAGCGKTFVLTERFLTQLEPGFDGAPPDEPLHHLIAITFTDRAAREMRDRIRAKCYQRLQAAPAQQVDYWLRLWRSLDTARVSTIHAFCGALLRSHAVEARLDPQFTVIEQSQADTLLAEISEDVLREKLNQHDDALHEKVVNLISNFGLERLQAMIAEMLSTGRTIDFELWLNRSPKDVAAVWDDYRKEAVVPMLLNQLANSPASRDLLHVIANLGAVSGELQNRAAALSRLLPGLPASRDPANDLDEIAGHARVQGAGSKKSWPDEVLYDRFKSAAETVRDEVKRSKKFLACDLGAIEEDAVAGWQLLAVTQEVLHGYERRKQELAWLDFNDLLTRACRLLTDPQHAELQQNLAGQVRLLLVDECQDTDPLQVRLIKALCGPRCYDGKLFFVGDYKQSIYRFRGADPSVFRRLQEETPAAGRLPLTVNFRSQPAILDFVNALFCAALSPLGGGGDTSLRFQSLCAKRPQTTPAPAVEFLWAMSEDQKHSTAGSKQQARKQEAEFIARRIRGMLERQENIVGQRQPDDSWVARGIKQKDIAILFRTLSDVQLYEEALRKYGINYYLVGGHAFYAQQEIYDIVNLLRTLASPADVVSLAGVLRSPMFALTDETLFWLAQHPQGLAGGLFAEHLPPELSADDRRRAEFAAATLRHLRRCKDRLSIAALLNEALQLTGYDATLLGEFLGERKLANLRKLIDQARSFDQSGVLVLSDFIVQLSRFVAEMPREPLAATQPEDTDVVRLMTIHQAKGLEFPVVFVPDLNRQAQHERPSAVWSAELGPLVKVPTRRESGDGIAGLDLHLAMFDAEERAERLRLFYVATTRAADYLVLSAGLSANEFEAPGGPWLKLLAERFDLRSGQCIAVLPPMEEYRAPQIRVTTELPPVERRSGTARHWQDLEKAVDRAVSMSQEMRGQSDEADPHVQLWQPIAVDGAARRRFSVSRLSGMLETAEEPTALMAPVDEAEFPLPSGSAADLGTLVHQVMARLKFGRPVAVGEFVERCVECQRGSTSELIDLAVPMIERFLQSKRAAEMAAAKVIHTELEFLLPWPPRENDAAANRNGLYLQGFIDCLYRDALGGWHLLDYKTNQISTASQAVVAAKYEMQMGVYALAVEVILGGPPVEIAVHFLRTGGEHHFDWNDELRDRTIDTVNRAIVKLVGTLREIRSAGQTPPRHGDRHA